MIKNKFKLTISLLLFSMLIYSLLVFMTKLPNNPYFSKSEFTSVKLGKMLSDNIIPENIYVHATNSPQRAKEYSKYYKNFEVDIFIDKEKMTLDIFHYPEHDSIGFDLYDLIEIIEHSPDNNYWLDVKNLSFNNVLVLDKILLDLIKKTKHLKKDSFLIESKNSSILSMLYNMGYQTSFYLSFDYISNKKCPNNSKSTSLLDKIKEHPNSFISFPLYNEYVIKKCLGDYTDDLQMLSWTGPAEDMFSPKAKEYKMFIINHYLISEQKTHSFYEKLIFELEKIKHNIIYLKYFLTSDNIRNNHDIHVDTG